MAMDKVSTKCKMKLNRLAGARRLMGSGSVSHHAVIHPVAVMFNTTHLLLSLVAICLALYTFLYCYDMLEGLLQCYVLLETMIKCLILKAGRLSGFYDEPFGIHLPHLCFG